MNVRLKFILIVLSLIVLPETVYAECQERWEIPQLATSSYSSIELQSESRRKVVTIYTSWFRRLSEIKRGIDHQSGIHTKLFLCNDSKPNAFAYRESGQNMVIITTGMYRLLGNDWDAYAALLGHENTHIIRKHGIKRQWRGLGTTIFKILGQTVMREITDDRSFGEAIGVSAVDMLGDAVYYSYSRDEEHEADSYGIQYAMRAGYDPRGAIRLHEKLNSASDFLSSHPSSADRIARINAYIANTSPSQAINEAKSDSNAKPNNRIGIVVGYNQHFKYYTASKTSLDLVQKGQKVEINIGESNAVVGTVERVVGDYFSVMTKSDSINETIIGTEVRLK